MSKTKRFFMSYRDICMHSHNLHGSDLDIYRHMRIDRIFTQAVTRLNK